METTTTATAAFSGRRRNAKSKSELTLRRSVWRRRPRRVFVPFANCPPISMLIPALFLFALLSFLNAHSAAYFLQSILHFMPFRFSATVALLKTNGLKVGGGGGI